MVVKGRWSVDVSSSTLNILKLGVGGQVLKQPELRQELSQYSRNMVWAISIILQKSGCSHPKTSFFIKIQVLQIINTHLGIRCGICAERVLCGSQLLQGSGGCWCVPLLDHRVLTSPFSHEAGLFCE